MPMNLRDGNYYMPYESQHMILRDGKTVHAFQASIFNNLLKRGPFQWNTGKYENGIHRRGPLDEAYERELSGVSSDYVVSSNRQHQHANGEGKWNYNPFRSYDIKQQSLTDLRPENSSTPVVTKRRQTSPAATVFYSKRGGSREAIQVVENEHAESPPLRQRVLRWIPSLSFAAFFVMIAAKFFVRLTDSLIKAEKQTGKFFKTVARTFVACIVQIQRVVVHLLKRITRKKSLYNIHKTSTHIDLHRDGSVYKLRSIYKYLNLFMVLFPIIMAAVLFGSLMYQQNDNDEIDIAQWNLPNSDKLIISSTSNVSLWHIAPDPRPDSRNAIEILNDGHPIIFYLRDHDELVMNIEHRINVLKSLSDTGYHVIVPIQRITDVEFQSVWWTVAKKLKHKQSMYVWSDVRDIDRTKLYTDGLSALGMIPAGVVIETTVNKNLQILVRNLEIWKGGQSNTGEIWNYLKCPLSSSEVVSSEEQPNQLQNAIGLCLTTISFNADFKVRY